MEPNVLIQKCQEGETSEVFHAIRKEGADIHAVRAEDGFTPMHAAAQSGSFSILRLLVANGANVNAQDLEGNTPLMFAAKNGNTRSVDVLMEAGALSLVENKEGHTASELAEEAGHSRIVLRISQGKHDPDSAPAADESVDVSPESIEPEEPEEAPVKRVLKF